MHYPTYIRYWSTQAKLYCSHFGEGTWSDASFPMQARNDVQRQSTGDLNVRPSHVAATLRIKSMRRCVDSNGVL